MDKDTESHVTRQRGVDEHRTASLVARARALDSEAVDELVHAHLDELRAFVRFQVDPRLRVRESVSDIVQSACREVLEDLPAFDDRGSGSFRAWLFTATLNKAREKGRRHRAQKRDLCRDRPVEDLAGGVDRSRGDVYRSLLSLDASPSEHAIARERLELLERAMDKLAPDERDVLLLSRVVGLTHREIAPRLGRTERAVRSLVTRASVRLLAAMEGRSE